MIQRIQTLFLLLAAGSMGALAAVPFFSVPKDAGYAEVSVLGDQIFNIQDHTGLLVLFLAAGGLALISIFLFKNRKLQSRISMVALLLIFGGLGFATGILQKAGVFEIGQLDMQAGIALPLVGIILLILANVYIRKDDALVESSYSRLR